MLIRAVAVAVLLCCASAKAETIVFTDQSLWRAAVREVALSLAPQTVPMAGTAVVDDELSLTFPWNHGGIETFADGWKGDVHNLGPPDFTHVAFAKPVYAFGAMIGITGETADPTFDNLRLAFGGDTFTLSRTAFDSAAPAFFGIVSRSPISALHVTSVQSQMFYDVRQVEYAVEPSALVPLPAAASAALALLPLAAIGRRWRVWCDASRAWGG